MHLRGVKSTKSPACIFLFPGQRGTFAPPPISPFGSFHSQLPCQASSHQITKGHRDIFFHIDAKFSFPPSPQDVPSFTRHFLLFIFFFSAFITIKECVVLLAHYHAVKYLREYDNQFQRTDGRTDCASNFFSATIKFCKPI